MQGLDEEPGVTSTPEPAASSTRRYRFVRVAGRGTSRIRPPLPARSLRRSWSAPCWRAVLTERAHGGLDVAPLATARPSPLSGGGPGSTSQTSHNNALRQIRERGVYSVDPKDGSFPPVLVQHLSPSPLLSKERPASRWIRSTGRCDLVSTPERVVILVLCQAVELSQHEIHEATDLGPPIDSATYVYAQACARWRSEVLLKRSINTFAVLDLRGRHNRDVQHRHTMRGRDPYNIIAPQRSKRSKGLMDMVRRRSREVHKNGSQETPLSPNRDAA